MTTALSFLSKMKAWGLGLDKGSVKITRKGEGSLLIGHSEL